MSATFPRRLQTSLILGGIVLGSGALAEGLPITPGLWEVKTQNPVLGNEQAQQHCMKEPVFDPLTMMGKEEGCEITNQVISGNSVDYDLTCIDDQQTGKAEGHFSFTINGDQGYGKVDLKMSAGGQTMTMHFDMDAKRIGNC